MNNVKPITYGPDEESDVVDDDEDDDENIEQEDDTGLVQKNGVNEYVSQENVKEGSPRKSDNNIEQRSGGESKSVKRYICTVCEESHITQEGLLDHMKIHILLPIEANPFVCPLCGKDFSIEHELTEHMQTHKPKSVEQKNEPMSESKSWIVQSVTSHSLRWELETTSEDSYRAYDV